jgi:Uma2 family endonuclease
MHYAWLEGSEPMEVEVRKKLFTVDEYHRMAEVGILPEGRGFELIDGEIIQMSAMGDRHAVCVSRLTTFFVRAFGEQAVIYPQLPLRLTDFTEPEPDIVVYKPRADFYAKKKRTPQDALLLIEVSDTTLRFDQKVKLRLYAAAGIQEMWIEDLIHNILHVYRDPGGNNYQTHLSFRPGDVVSPIAFPDITFRVDELLSTDCEL